MPTFRNTLFHLHCQVGVKNELGLRNVGIFYGKRLGLKISSQAFSRIISQHFSNLVHSSHLPVNEDGTECSETSAHKIQTPGNYSEESIQCLQQFYVPQWNGQGQIYCASTYMLSLLGEYKTQTDIRDFISPYG
jgi:hypothetical protein